MAIQQNHNSDAPGKAHREERRMKVEEIKDDQ